MSAGYNIFPLSYICSDEGSAAWLLGIGLEPPPGWERSRAPILEDFRAALQGWKGSDCSEEVRGNEMTIRVHDLSAPGDVTFIYISSYADSRPNPDMSWLRFNYGRPDWLIAVVERLAQRCGPFLLTDDGGAATIVDAGTARHTDWAELR